MCSVVTARTGSGRSASGLPTTFENVVADLSPTARALRVLEMLQVRSLVTAADLAESLGVTERAARRYIAHPA